MKQLLTILILLLLSSLQVFSNCAWVSGFYDYTISGQYDYELIIVGEKVDEETVCIDNGSFIDGYNMIKVRIDEIWCGTVRTEISEEAPEWLADFPNSEEFIWLRSLGTCPNGLDWSSGYYDIQPGINVITIGYWGYSYGANYCSHYSLQVNDDDSLTGTVYWENPISDPPYYKNDLKEQILANALLCGASTGLDEVSSIDYNIFPNPSADFLYINAKSDQLEEGDLVLFNSNGQIVMEKNGVQNQARIDLSSLSPGIYFLQVQAGSQNRLVETVVKY